MRFLLTFLIVALITLNLGFFAWTRGVLDGLIGVGPSTGDRDPMRVTREVRPEAVKITPLNGKAPAAVDAACLESGPYSPGDVALAEVGVSSVAPPGTWSNMRRDRAGQWVVYLGPIADKETLARKEEEVKRTRVPFETITERGELDLGFLLGRFDVLKDANAALERLARQAPLRNARVVTLVQPTTEHVLRIESASAAIAQRLQALKGGVLKPFVPCVKAEASGQF